MTPSTPSDLWSGLCKLLAPITNIWTGAPDADEFYELPIVRKAVLDPHKKFFDMFNGFSGEVRRSRAPGFHRLIEGKPKPGTEVLIRYPDDRDDLHLWLNAAITHIKDHWNGEAKFTQPVDKDGVLIEDDRDLRLWIRAYAELLGVRINFAQNHFAPQDDADIAARQKQIKPPAAYM